MVKPSKKPQRSLLDQFKESESSASIVFGAIVVVVVGLLLFNFYKAGKSPMTGSGEMTEGAAGAQKEPTLPAKHTVTSGEHLWKIAEHYYGDGYKWTEIATANGLKNPSSIKVGVELQIPALEPKLEAAPATSQIQGESYTIKKGDSLWKIAVAAYGDGYKWTSIWKANKQSVPNANMLFVGTTLTLPR